MKSLEFSALAIACSTNLNAEAGDIAGMAYFVFMFTMSRLFLVLAVIFAFAGA